MIEVLNPEGVLRRAALEPAARPASLHARTVGLHDNRKPGAVDLLSGIASILAEDGVTVEAWRKAHAARPSPHVAALSVAAEAVVLALGD